MIFTLCIPRAAIDEDRARGTDAAPGATVTAPPSSAVLAVLSDRRLLMLAAVITLFDLGNDQMTPLLGQRLAVEGNGNPITWIAIWILIAQMTMIPMSLIGARIAERRGAVKLLLVSCVVLAMRAMLAASTSGPWWVIAIQFMDGIGAGLISVAGPIAVTDLTYGSGRTQTALGSLGALRGLAAAVSAIVGGAVATRVGWEAALGMLAVPPIAALPLLIRLMRQQSGAQSRAHRPTQLDRRGPRPR
jgi:MFS family permease